MGLSDRAVQDWSRGIRAREDGIPAPHAFLPHAGCPTRRHRAFGERGEGGGGAEHRRGSFVCCV